LFGANRNNFTARLDAKFWGDFDGMSETQSITPENYQAYMRYALSLAKRAPPKSTNYCVGAVLVDETSNRILSTNYTMELPGNTHAEQCCLAKAAGGIESHGETLPSLALYTTMKSCNQRTSGNTLCTKTILKATSDLKCRIKIVYVGVQESEKFVGENTERSKLENAGIKYVHVSGLEDEILAVATSGHL
jgi:pyrimidine deaminase RibD-like protein